MLSRSAPIVITALALAPAAHAAFVVRSAGGDATAASITAARDQFRVDLGGGTTAGANGSFGGVRREINWDGTPANFSAPNLLPASFFNANSPRGVVFSTPGAGFMVSGATTDAGAGQPAAANFGSLNASYTATFSQFSPQRLFTAIGSNILDVTFFIPGTGTPATVSGFGAVFTDVDTATGARLQFFNAANAEIFNQAVPAGTAASGSLSLLGAFGNAGEQIARVRITSGNVALGSVANDGVNDLIAMDDFLYSEPVPAPAGAAALSAGLLLTRRRRRTP